ncbi:MAG TPA: hypothetical protein VHS96_16545 [Bacteroidia bacterium]|nr:hypothetical protein [Bacteroidia bacterium]
MDQKQESNLILQRIVGGPDNQMRIVVKDPQAEFRVIGIIRQGTISEQGKQVPIYHLYSLNGTLVASEKNREYLEEVTTVKAQGKLRQAAMEKWREEELAKARGAEQPEKDPTKEAPKNKNKAKEGQER